MQDQVIEDVQRLSILTAIGIIDFQILDILRDPALTDPFGDGCAFRFQLTILEILVQRRAAWISDADLHVLALLLQVFRNTGQRAARPDRADETRRFALFHQQLEDARNSPR